MPICFMCRRTLTTEVEMDDILYDGGWVVVSFGYGSDMDQGPMHAGVQKVTVHGDDRLDKLLCCDEIRGAICDPCFRTVAQFFDGYRVRRLPPEKTKRV